MNYQCDVPASGGTISRATVNLRAKMSDDPRIMGPFLQQAHKVQDMESGKVWTEWRKLEIVPHDAPDVEGL